MRKKQANLYFIPESLSQPPHLTPQQLSEFKSQYTLFDDMLDIRRLKDSFTLFNASVPPHENYKPVEKFIHEIDSSNGKLGFEEYLGEINEFIESQNEGELLIELIGQGKKQIKCKVIQQILEEVLGRQISDKELTSILDKVFDLTNPTGTIASEQVKSLFSNSKN